VNSDKPGMMFSEVMSGGFALNETDPEAGAKTGKGQPLTMHGTITIDDLDAFIAAAARMLALPHPSAIHRRHLRHR